MSELNRRIILGNDIVYPITKAENVIHLQKEIKKKLPISSSNTPENIVEGQVWLDTSDLIGENGEILSTPQSFTLLSTSNTVYNSINTDAISLVSTLESTSVSTLESDNSNEYTELDSDDSVVYENIQQQTEYHTLD